VSFDTVEIWRTEAASLARPKCRVKRANLADTSLRSRSRISMVYTGMDGRGLLKSSVGLGGGYHTQIVTTAHLMAVLLCRGPKWHRQESSGRVDLVYGGLQAIVIRR